MRSWATDRASPSPPGPRGRRGPGHPRSQDHPADDHRRDDRDEPSRDGPADDRRGQDGLDGPSGERLRDGHPLGHRGAEGHRRRREASAGQAASEPGPAPVQAALDRPHRAFQVAGRLVQAAAFQVAQDERLSESLGQALDLLMDRRIVDEASGIDRGLPPPRLAGVPLHEGSPIGRLFARIARRKATRWSQGPTDSRTQSERPRRARVANVSWNASSAACSSRRTARQVLKTIAPWRSTRAENARSAASPGPRAKRSSNWPSVLPATVPQSSNARSPRRPVLSDLASMRLAPFAG